MTKYYNKELLKNPKILQNMHICFGARRTGVIYYELKKRGLNMTKEEKIKKLNDLKDKIIENLSTCTFNELLVLLGESTESLIRSCIVDSMEKYYPEEYNKYLGDEYICMSENMKK